MNENNISVALFGGFLVGSIGGVFLLTELGVESILIITPICLITGAAGAIGALFLLTGVKVKKDIAISDNADNSHFFDDTLTLSDFNSKNGDPIKIKSFYDYNINYHPSDIRYVGVTVGGVTTGGTYDAGNYYTNDATKTGKYQLVYESLNYPDGAVIEKIKLHGKNGKIK